MADEGYSIKEVVNLTRQEQSTGFSRIEILLANKADKSDLATANQRLDDHDGHIRTLQDAAIAESTAESKKSGRSADIKWGIGVATIIAATLLGTLLAHFIR